tara:strand:- start:37471 stop:39099 length:1629 start_codon:yes stop_codon:yes gene_type:complete
MKFSVIRFVFLIVTLILSLHPPAFADEEDITRIDKVESDVITFKDVQVRFPAPMLDGWEATGEGTAWVDIRAKLLIYTLWGEPVVYCTANWTFKKAQTNNSFVSTIKGVGTYVPDDIAEKIDLYSVDLKFSSSLFENVWVECDPGIFGASGDPNVSFNIPGSPSWDDLFQSNGFEISDATKRAKSYYRDLLKTGKVQTNALHEVQKAHINLYAVGEWLAKRDQKIAQDKLDQARTRQNDIPDDPEKEISEADIQNLFESTFRAQRLEQIQDRFPTDIPVNEDLLARAENLKQQIASCPSFHQPDGFEDAPEALVSYRACLPSPLDELVKFSVDEGNDSRCGYKNKQGKVVLEAEYTNCSASLNGIGLVNKIVGTREINVPMFGLCSGRCSGGTVSHTTHTENITKWTIINSRGETLAQEGNAADFFGFEPYRFRFYDGYLVLTRKENDVEQDFVYDTRMKLKMSLPENWHYQGYSEGLFVLRSNADRNDDGEYLFGYYDFDGQFAFAPIEAKDADPFEKGLARVEFSDGDVLYFDKNGRYVR